MINKKTLLALATMLISASAKPIKVKTLIDTLKMVRGHMATVQPTGNLARYEDEEISVCMAGEHRLDSDDLCCVAGLQDPTQVASFDISQPPRTMIPIVHLPGAGPAPAAFSSCKQIFTQEELEKFPLAPGYVLFSESGNPKMFLHSYVVVHHLQSISASLGLAQATLTQATLAQATLEQAASVYPTDYRVDACPWKLAMKITAQINDVLSRLQKEPDPDHEIDLNPAGEIQSISSQLNSLQEMLSQLLKESRQAQKDPSSPLFIPPAASFETAAQASSSVHVPEPEPRAWETAPDYGSQGRYDCYNKSPGGKSLPSTPGKRSRHSMETQDSPMSIIRSPGMVPLCDQETFLEQQRAKAMRRAGQDSTGPTFSAATPGKTNGRRTKRMMLEPYADSINAPNLDDSGVFEPALPRELDAFNSRCPGSSWDGLGEQAALATLQSLPPLDSGELSRFPGMDGSVGALDFDGDESFGDQSLAHLAGPPCSMAAAAAPNPYDQAEEEPPARGLSVFSATSEQPQVPPFTFHPDDAQSLGLVPMAPSPRTSLASQSTDSSSGGELLTDSDD